MKRPFYVIAFAFFALTLNSCDWFEDATTKDVNFESDVSVEFNANQQDSKTVVEELILDPLTDEDILQYKDDIKNLEITGFGYIVKGFNSASETLTFSGKLEYSEGAGSKKLLATFTNVDIKSLAASGIEQSLSVPATEVSNIVRIFENHNGITLHLSGELSDIPADFDMEIISHLKVKAEVTL